nr:glycerol-3-phosphate acyltransferase, chloroplastic [Tanacetum cinerariifolium]
MATKGNLGEVVTTCEMSWASSDGHQGEKRFIGYHGTGISVAPEVNFEEATATRGSPGESSTGSCRRGEGEQMRVLILELILMLHVNSGL